MGRVEVWRMVGGTNASNLLFFTFLLYEEREREEKGMLNCINIWR